MDAASASGRVPAGATTFFAAAIDMTTELYVEFGAPQTRRMKTAFTAQVGVDVPLICGAMYPCSNPELVAAVSAAGGIGVVQPLSMEFVFELSLEEGLRRIRALTDRPVGINLIIERSSQVYLKRVRRWLEVALDEGVDFYVTALGDPKFVVDRVRERRPGAVVYHDVTERRFAEKAAAAGVDGLICVNDRAGGHAGTRRPAALFAELEDLGLPLICAGGVGDEGRFVEALELGYAGAQLGTRFIATEECRVHADYKQAVVDAGEDDIVLTERLSGVPVSIIKTPFVEKTGTKAGWLARKLLKGRRTKHWVRAWYSLKSAWQLGRASQRAVTHRDSLQAGKSVEGVTKIEPAGEIVRRFAAALEEA